MSQLKFKQALYIFCSEFVNHRIAGIQGQVKEIQAALESETKSSAGDKHETGRAMLQLEREKLGKQLADAEVMRKTLDKVDISGSKNTASLGSLVCTEKADYFLAISAGEYIKTKKKTYCISLNTPIGIMLLGKKVGDKIRFNENEFSVLEIV